MKQRLQKILAQAGICSRRKAEEYICAGRVAVDGKTITQLGLKFDPDHNRITFDGKPLPPSDKKTYVLLNKPKGYVTTLKDPQKRPIVSSLLKEIPTRLFPVGRLDIDTEGALLLTNDGDFAQQILHPSNEISRTYKATVAGYPSPDKIISLEKGIEIDGKMTWPAKVKVLGRTKDRSFVRIIIHEGRKRQVRKMFAAIGHPVLDLQRTAYGGLHLGKLQKGSYKILSEPDLKKIFKQ